ncbi:MAG: YncE family protein, partial [Candidatus Woesearchaeota archaeon]
MKAGNSLLYFTDSDKNIFIIFNPKTGGITEINTGWNPEALAVSRDYKIAVTANRDSDNNVKSDTISIIDIEKKKELGQVIAGDRPISVAISPDSRFALAGLKDGEIVSINLEEKRVDGRLSAGKNPAAISYSEDGKVAYALSRDEEKLYIIDTEHMKISAEISLGNGAYAFAVKDRRTLLVANSEDDTISVIDLMLMKIIEDNTVGYAPKDIVLSMTDAYVADTGSNEISIISLSDMREYDVIDTGAEPFKLALDGEKLYVLFD